MCESKAVILEKDSEVPVMDDVIVLSLQEDGSLKLVNIEGKELVLKDIVIDHIDFLKHKIYLRKK